MKITAFIAIAGACLAITEAGYTKISSSTDPDENQDQDDPQQDDHLQQENQQQGGDKWQKGTYGAPTPAPAKKQNPVKHEWPAVCDALEQFPQPPPKSVTEKAAIVFLPQLDVGDGELRPTAAVDCHGKVTTGKTTVGKDCGAYKQKTQVYGRSAWYGRLWAIMYAWHFPLNTAPFLVWKHVIVWTNNPNVTDPIILGVSTSTSTPGQYMSQVPFHDGKVTDKSVKVSYSKGQLVSTSEKGQQQPLIFWHQMPEAAQKALNNGALFNGVPVPFNDDNFPLNLGTAFPFARPADAPVSKYN